MSRSTESAPIPTSRSRSGTEPANAAISMAWAGPVGLSKSRIMRQLMSRSWRASRTPALTPSHTVSTGTPRRMTKPGEKNISR